MLRGSLAVLTMLAAGFVAGPALGGQAAPPPPLPGCGATGSAAWLATRPSPLDSVVVALAGTGALKVCYSRPQLRGRALDGLVPPGKAWRTGANEPTLLLLTAPAVVGGLALAPGRYVLLTVPGERTWTLLLHTTPETAPARMFTTLTPVGTGAGIVESATDAVEQFTIRGTTGEAGPELLLEWGRVRVRVPIVAPDR